MQLHARRRQDPDTGSTREPTQVVSDRSLVVRNYDGTEAHEVRVTFLDPDGDRAFARTVAVASLSVPPSFSTRPPVSVGL